MIFNSTDYNQDWQDKQLSELGTFKRGKSRHRPRNDLQLFEDGQYPLIQTGEVKAANLYINSHTNCYNDFGLKQSAIWPKDTLCITIAANIAETALLDYPMCFPDSVVGFNADPQESSELFMHYVFTYIRKAIQNSASGSIQDNINIEYLTGLDFKIPKKDYQDKIVNVLSILDKKIDLNEQINSELQSLARTLYEYWFYQFDFPNEDGKPYKSSGGEMAFNKVLKRDIPVKWCNSSLSGITGVSNDTISPSDEPNKEYRHFSIPVLDSTNTYGVELGDSIGSDKFVVTSDDLLVSKLNPWFNRVVYATDESEQICSTEFVVWRCPNKAIKNFLYMIATSPRFIKYCSQSSTGTSNSHKRVNPSVMMRLEVPFDISIAEKLGNKLEPIINTIINKQKENTKLKELRDWLLPLLMNGQVKVK
ncbi:restriction endonuclease subunit S [Pseudoalteromonas phenolica]|uniref:Putative type-1 restriction enzyme MjaXP specificity protein n=1 Tax=Pseudoalteromonas phenolica TaxID=161398 RepID=A0A0S2JXU3_9GAMM|nr:restriction endonuclease subunit S [Pseudoalteromonas phenolica]ALO40967.1 Putative type-1 restriction enzyme MjaXP specificity protein [Pseudoalteromonas phenolica]MBE0354512.1 type I restriction enzyme, S subunit [Pseudoalteromonas phenolica O-BC30]